MDGSIQSFRHIECQNLSIISESIGIPYRSKKIGKKWGGGVGGGVGTEEEHGILFI